MNAPNAIQLTAMAALLVTFQVFAGKYDPESLKVKATDLLTADLLKGKHHRAG